MLKAWETKSEGIVKTCAKGIGRDHCSKQNFTAELGARHRVLIDDGLLKFFKRVDAGLMEIAGIEETMPSETDPSGWKTNKMPRHKVYNDPKKIGMSVVEMRLSRNFAKNKRIQWNRADLGRAKQQISDEVYNLGLEGQGEVIPSRIPVPLSGLLRVGSTDKHDGTRKLALTVDPASQAAEFIVREQEIIIDGLATAMNDEEFTYPYDEYVPKLTIGRISREVPDDKVDRCFRYVQNLLPLTVNILPVHFMPELK